MADIDLALRTEIFRAQPSLSLPHANSLIQGVACDCLAILDDNTACGVTQQHHDFVTFSHVDGVALAVVFRKSDVEFLAFAADESLIGETEHLAMNEADEFLKVVRTRFRLPEVGTTFSLSDALPWMRQYS
jgi:hypothetical protein